MARKPPPSKGGQRRGNTGGGNQGNVRSASAAAAPVDDGFGSMGSRDMEGSWFSDLINDLTAAFLPCGGPDQQGAGCCGVDEWEPLEVGDLVSVPNGQWGEVIEVDMKRELLAIEVRTRDGNVHWYAEGRLKRLRLRGEQQQRLRKELQEVAQAVEQQNGGEELIEKQAETSAAASNLTGGSAGSDNGQRSAKNSRAAEPPARAKDSKKDRPKAAQSRREEAPASAASAVTQAPTQKRRQHGNLEDGREASAINSSIASVAQALQAAAQPEGLPTSQAIPSAATHSNSPVAQSSVGAAAAAGCPTEDELRTQRKRVEEALAEWDDAEFVSATPQADASSVGAFTFHSAGTGGAASVPAASPNASGVASQQSPQSCDDWHSFPSAASSIPGQQTPNEGETVADEGWADFSSAPVVQNVVASAGDPTSSSAEPVPNAACVANPADADTLATEEACDDDDFDDFQAAPLPTATLSSDTTTVVLSSEQERQRAPSPPSEHAEANAITESQEAKNGDTLQPPTFDSDPFAALVAGEPASTAAGVAVTGNTAALTAGVQMEDPCASAQSAALPAEPAEAEEDIWAAAAAEHAAIQALERSSASVVQEAHFPSGMHASEVGGSSASTASPSCGDANEKSVPIQISVEVGDSTCLDAAPNSSGAAPTSQALASPASDSLDKPADLAAGHKQSVSTATSDTPDTVSVDAAAPAPIQPPTAREDDPFAGL